MRNRKSSAPAVVADRAPIDSALRTLEAEFGGISALATAMQNGLGPNFVDAVETIRGSARPRNRQRHGQVRPYRPQDRCHLSSTGTPAFFVHPAEASHGDLGMIAPEDVVIALSWSGETAELKSLIDYSRRFRIPLIAVTAVATSTLAQAADVVLALPQAREACPHNLAPTTSSLMQLAIGDALAIALMESRGFTALDFRDVHPGGRLGALLKFVRDVMHTGEKIPLVASGAAMSAALLEMSAKGFGCVGVIDNDGS